MKYFHYIVAISVLIGSCKGEDSRQVQGLRPVYGSVSDLQNMIKSTQNQSLKNPGKIYVKDQFLFINEVLKGVHVFDNSDPSNPQKVSFISIPGNLDVAIKGNYLYADYSSGLATIEISDINNVKLTHFDVGYNSVDNGQQYPPKAAYTSISGDKIYFECPDASKGLVINWEKVSMPQPQCHFNNPM